jgi:hypothetical protein
MGVVHTPKSSTDAVQSRPRSDGAGTLSCMTDIDYDRLADEVRSGLDLRTDEGAIVAILLGGFAPEVAMVIDDGRSHLEEIGPNLGWILDELTDDDVTGVLLVVARVDGTVTEQDRQLLAHVRSVVRAMPIVDLLVVGQSTWVSVDQAIAA